jgi:hypothetical protein
VTAFLLSETTHNFEMNFEMIEAEQTHSLLNRCSGKSPILFFSLLE